MSQAIEAGHEIGAHYFDKDGDLHIQAGRNIYFDGAGFSNGSAADALTAHAGGGQANGTPITTNIARFTVVATIADSGTLPLAFPGAEITVINAAANSMNVFPAVGDQINALGANAALAVAGAAVTIFFCTVAGQWHSK